LRNKILLHICLSFFFTFSLLPVYAADGPQTLPKLKKKFLAPDFTLVDVDGKKHRLADYRGKVVMLNFWATWCPPCRYEMPSMGRAHNKLKNDNVVILAVDVGEDEDTIFSFTASYDLPFTILLDEKGKTIKLYPVTGLPTTYLIDTRGYATHRIVGSREWDSPAILEQLRKMGKKK